jgi:DNA primase
LPGGEDPDTFVRKRGGQGYADRLRQSQPYLDYLLDRVASGHNLNTDEGRVRFITEMVPIASRIPDEVARERFADRLAQRTRIATDVIRAEIRKSKGEKRVGSTIQDIPSFGQVTKAEKGLIWWLVHDPAPALAALRTLEPGDLEGLAAGSVLDLALELNENGGFAPSVLLERLSMVEAQLVTGIASEREPHVHDPQGCIRILRRLRCEREYAALQQEIDRLQQSGIASSDARQIDALWVRKHALKLQIQDLI